MHDYPSHDGHLHSHAGNPSHGSLGGDWMMRLREHRLHLGVLAFLLALWATFFTVRETEFVLVTQFGRPVATVTEAGLHAKWPFHSARYFDRRLRVYNPRPSEFLTRDKKNLVIESYVLWRIADPQTFVESVGDAVAAEMRLHDIAWAGLAAAIGNHDLDAIVSVEAQTVRTGSMLDKLTELTGSRALAEYGIDVVDIRVKRLNLPEQNKQSVFARMRAERERIARRYRAEGEEQAPRIRADADRQSQETLSPAYKEAERIKGEGDADAARIYGEAYARNPRFYKFVRTLEAYRKALDEETTVVLSSDSELPRLLTRGQ